MPGTRWPDFRLASTIWSLVGSPSSKKTASSNGIDNRVATDAPTEPLQPDLDFQLSKESELGRVIQPDGNIAIMNGYQDRPNDGLGAFDSFDDPTGPVIDDFGPLEMFDSTAFSSQVNTGAFSSNSQVPAAIMSMEAPPSAQPSEKKSKRERKDKKKNGVDFSPAVANLQEEGNHKRAKRQSNIEAEDSLTTATEPLTLNEDPVAALAATQQNRKRKASDAASAEVKRRKKRKSQEQSVDASSQLLGENNGGVTDPDTEFLHKNTNPRNASVTAIGDEDADGSDPQGSPTIAHLRRRSMSGERSRENSTVPGLQLPDIDQGNGAGPKHDHDALANINVENLAREAWNEHINGLTRDSTTNGDAVDVDMTDAGKTSENEIVNEAPGTPDRPATSPRVRRSARAKKAKPSFFDQPAQEDQENHDGAAEMPSPSAMTPKPRKRAKAATKKVRTPKLSQSMKADNESEVDNHDGNDEGAEAEGGYVNNEYVHEEDVPRSRRNRMAGYVMGRFTDEEIERLGKAIAAFGVEKDLTQQEVNEMIHAAGGTTAGEAHAQLWTMLFAECPDRHRQKVINITRKKFHNFVARGTWTPEQEAELRLLIGIHGRKWSQIAAIINRHPEDIRDRYRNYIVCGDAQRRDSWDETEEERLTAYVISAMKEIDELRIVHPNRPMLQKTYEELVDWQNISELMDRTRSRLQCITKWKAMNLRTHGKDQLQSQLPDTQITFQLERARRQITDMPESERQRLLLAINECQVTSDSKIPWHKLVDKSFRTEWHKTTLQLLWFRLRKGVLDGQNKTVRDCATYLCQQFHQAGDLPDVEGDDADDAEESAYLRAFSGTVASGAKKRATKQKKTRGEVSSEFVVDSDAEGKEEQEATNEQAEEALDEGMQIDPALMEASASTEGVNPAEEPALVEDPAPIEGVALPEFLPEESSPPKKTPAKTPSKRTTYGKRKGSAKKALMLSQDPIQDDDTQTTEGKQEEGSQVLEEPVSKKKKTPGKFKTSAKVKKRDVTPEAPNVPSSDMDDMEDLPARVPAREGM